MRRFTTILVIVLLAVPCMSGMGSAVAADVGSVHLPLVKAGRERPLVAIVADNGGTETTDLIVPYSVLKMADVADVVIVSIHPGPVSLMPALKIQADKTMLAFDAAHPDGADIVIVPAMHDSGNEAVIAWVRHQSGKRAVVVSICEGAWIAARAGLLDGRAATTHWYAFDKIASAFPKTRWLRDQRYVFDRGVMTTTGVTASIPASLALVEALAGRSKAKATAAKLGVENWTAAHESAPFRLTAWGMWLVARNFLSFWKHETLAIPVMDGFDEIALALSADAWSRTYRSQAIATSAKGPVASRYGLVLIPDRATDTGTVQLTLNGTTGSAHALDRTLKEMAARYGDATADLVALQLEYVR
ncbi:thiamine biosynthesis protein ThiJ [Rhodopseudomonas boonkerdii]|uniref:DJ-1/PfpI family protein n=1 Tax=Rhodopseudomonas boonkerdii TaxID=475937 RepID=UPI001E61B527|nr:DJ-1/PfpI family protein [Rhodopseudomonas boonkerdii]UGV28237.1 thiamine biosynthesis protein ThiJ [Rhodopseudomonas boonkerdii]